MKLILTLLCTIIISCASHSYGQVIDTPSVAPPSEAVIEEPAEPAAPTQAAAPAKAPAPVRAAPVRKSADTIRGNAGKNVMMVDAKGDCANGLKPIGITNTHPNWAMKVAVDMSVVFMGRIIKKTIILDNLVAGETRFIGCTGCVSNQTGETCTTYKITIAQYKSK